jgi:hypothetical protein
MPAPRPRPAAVKLRDAQITLICMVAGLSELECDTIQIGGTER